MDGGDVDADRAGRGACRPRRAHRGRTTTGSWRQWLRAPRYAPDGSRWRTWTSPARSGSSTWKRTRWSRAPYAAHAPPSWLPDGSGILLTGRRLDRPLDRSGLRRLVEPLDPSGRCRGGRPRPGRCAPSRRAASARSARGRDRGGRPRSPYLDRRRIAAHRRWVRSMPATSSRAPATSASAPSSFAPGEEAIVVVILATADERRLARTHRARRARRRRSATS